MLKAKWKKNESEIINSHQYHLADTTRYFWEMQPKPDADVVSYEGHYHAAKQHHMEAREKYEANLRKLKQQKSKLWGRRAR